MISVHSPCRVRLLDKDWITWWRSSSGWTRNVKHAKVYKTFLWAKKMAGRTWDECGTHYGCCVEELDPVGVKVINQPYTFLRGKACILGMEGKKDMTQFTGELGKKAEVVTKALNEIQRIWSLELSALALGSPRKLDVEGCIEESHEAINNLASELGNFADDTDEVEARKKGLL